MVSITGSSFSGHGPTAFVLCKHPRKVVWFYPQPKSASDFTKICPLLLLFPSFYSHLSRSASASFILLWDATLVALP